MSRKIILENNNYTSLLKNTNEEYEISSHQETLDLVIDYVESFLLNDLECRNSNMDCSFMFFVEAILNDTSDLIFIAYTYAQKKLTFEIIYPKKSNISLIALSYLQSLVVFPDATGDVFTERAK